MVIKLKLRNYWLILIFKKIGNVVFLLTASNGYLTVYLFKHSEESNKSICVRLKYKSLSIK